MGADHLASQQAHQQPDPRREWLAAVYDAQADGLYRYAVMLLADPAAAEDAVQQVFARLAGPGREAAVESPAAYLRSAVRNECFDAMRRRGRRGETALTEAAFLVPARPEADPEQRALLESALRALPPEQREVVHLKVYEQMTFQDIARVVAAPANTVASRYRYAMDKLRGLLARHVQL